MTLDLWLLGALVLFGLLGLFSGAIKQLSQWIGLAAAYLFAKPLAAALAPLAAERLGIPALLAPLVVGGTAFPLIFFGGSLLAHLLLKRALPAGEKGRTDRGVGFLMGAAKAGAIVFILLSVVLAFEEPLGKAGWNVAKETDGSRAAAFVRGHNLFSRLHIPALEKAQKLAAARDPQAALALLNDPKIKKLLQDPELAKQFQALGAGGVSPQALLNDPKIKQLLQDPELAKKLAELQAASVSRPTTAP